MIVNTEEATAKLTYLSHDARTVLSAMGRHDLNIHWQIRLMEACYNYNLTTVMNIMMDQDKKLMGYPLLHVIKEGLPHLGRRKQHHNAMFMPEGMANLLFLDKSILMADYTVRLENLANMLNKLDREGLNDILSGVNRCGMNLLMIKIEEFMGDRERQWKEVRTMATRVPPKPGKMSVDARIGIARAIADIDLFRSTRDKPGR